MSKKSRIRTLSDLNGNALNTGGDQHASAYHKPISSSSSSSSSNATASGPMAFDRFRVCHVPTLPLADSAKAMMERVCKEFEPIVKRRGYNVKSVSEMCCCFDGLDFTASGERRKGRKCRVMPHNVWGYNQTTTRGRGHQKSHTVHLRLRHPRSHDRLLLYEDVAGTMAHELAHCEIGPHNDAFNKLMDEILEEHMLLQSQSIAGGGAGGPFAAGFASFAGQGNKLGSGGGDDKTAATTDPRHPGYKLGGDISFTKWLAPAQAACMAAEARRRQQKLRLRGQHCCQPCTITIPDSDDDVENAASDAKPAAKKRGATATTTKTANPTKVTRKDKSSATSAAVARGDTRKKKSKTSSSQEPKRQEAVIDLTENEDGVSKAVNAGKADVAWPCKRCTYVNQFMALACSMCSSQKA